MTTNRQLDFCHHVLPVVRLGACKNGHDVKLLWCFERGENAYNQMYRKPGSRLVAER